MSGAAVSAADQSIARLSRPRAYDAPLTRILMLLCACYGSTIAALYWVGVQPVVPWSLLLVFVLVVIPFALGAAGAVTLVVGHPACGTAMARSGSRGRSCSMRRPVDGQEHPEVPRTDAQQ